MLDNVGKRCGQLVTIFAVTGFPQILNKLGDG